MKPVGLYIDFPFCLARCAFCAFNIQGYREGFASRYIDALRRELTLHADAALWEDRVVTSLYLGGGTPSLYPAEVLTDLIGLCRERFPIAPDVEITLEAHPATIDSAGLRSLRKGGINRLSMGVQSFSDDHLKALGRHHTAEVARAAFFAAREAGFTNVGIDLIYSLPALPAFLDGLNSLEKGTATKNGAVTGQPFSDWEATLHAAIDLAPEHLSLYGLSIEEGTLFDKKKKAGILSLPSEREAIAQYQTAQERLAAAGLRQYEISNFARPGRECRHNLLYWERGEVLGVGLSAHSYIHREHRANIDSLPAYLEAIESDRLPIDQIETISPETLRKDRVIFGLRKTEGIPLEYLEEDPSLQKTADRLIENGLLTIDRQQIRLTDKGMLLADEVALAFL